MRDILDELVEVIAELWERSSNEEIEPLDIALHFKAALLLAEGETYLKEEKSSKFLKKMFDVTKKKNYPTDGVTPSSKKKFKFGRS